MALVVISPLSHFNCNYLSPLPFFRGESSERLVCFVYLFKEPALQFLDLLYDLFSLLFLLSSVISSLFLTVGFVLLFLVPRGVELGCLRLVLFEVGPYHHKLPSLKCFCRIPQIATCYTLISLKVY